MTARPRGRGATGSGFLLLGLVASAAVAQDAPVAIRGIVLDEVGRQPVVAAQVDILEPGRTASTGRDGRFAFTGLRAAAFIVEVRQVGYLPARATFDLAAGESVEIIFTLGPQATRLPEVVVEGAEPVHPSMAEFFRRRAEGHGHFITRQDIERLQPMLLSDLLDQVPGVRLECRRGRECWIDMGRAQPSLVGRPVCHVQYFVDGVRYGSPADEVDINSFRPEDIEGIEVYRGASGVPSRYTGRDARCGVVLLWMRIGKPRR
jgi:hypothetical protein